MQPPGTTSAMTPIIPNRTPQRPRLLVILPSVRIPAGIKQALEAEYTVTISSSDDLARCLPTADLILMDNRADLVALIRQQRSMLELPILVIAPVPSNSEMVRLLQAGINDYLHAPIEVDVLIARIRTQLMLKKRGDEQTFALQQMKRAYETRTRLMRIVSHDLKNPLNTIRLSQHYLRQTVGDQPEAVEALDSIEMTVNNMNDLIMDFLDSAALESGRVSLKLEMIEMDMLIWEALARHSAAANQKNIILLMGETEGTVLADRKRLLQVLTNLISNGIKYGPVDSVVTIESQIKGSSVLISVRDEGPGIPEAECAILFEPFSTLTPRPTGDESSTGLGLWIVREMVEMHGGVVRYEAAEKRGSIFTVELPLSAESLKQAV
jgi:two-component system, sensor histidine kinase and response regulator